MSHPSSYKGPKFGSMTLFLYASRVPNEVSVQDFLIKAFNSAKNSSIGLRLQ